MNTSNGQKKYDVILVAGEGKASYKVYHQNKAFLTLQGKCVILYVIEALQQVKSIGDIYIVGSKNKLEQVLHSSRIDCEFPKRIHVVEQKANLYENVWQTFLQSQQVEDTNPAPHRDKAVLIVPCDAPLITPHEVEYFISHADMDRYDHVLGLVSREKLRHFYPRDGKPGIKMAYLHILEDSFRINNLHLVKPLRIENREYIQKMYQYRYQRNFKNLVLFGLSVFGKDKAKHYKNYIGLQLCLFFGSLGLEFMIDYFRKLNPKKELEESISTIMKTRFSALEVPFPGAALDIDNAKDYEAMKTRFDEWQEYLRTAPLTSIEKYSKAFSPSRKVARTSSMN
ncbi:MAG: NTP transferase domain-containing protein [Nitrospinae bacterium]|nr:NTP transferase domain-containing protein [Nitrospinota bacterium]MZH15080.1 NTP transferase domain-containing protein [Nitrospinota bacterium]